MKAKLVVLAVVVGLLLILVGFVNRQPDKTDFETARENIVMRQVAHKILQYSGDSTSTVLPVTRVSQTEFQLPFNSSFSFKPDSLVAIIGKTLTENQLPADYIVQVAEPTGNKVVFGYAVLGTQQQSLVPCNGRSQPAKPYSISISFKEKPQRTRNWLLGTGILLLLVGGVTAWPKKKPIQQSPVDELPVAEVVNKPYRSIGNYQFYPQHQSLVLGAEAVVLTSKESKLLEIFSEVPNQLIDRNRLQKEVWEDEGVIVGRSLDVFVSKLRKRLEADPAIKIVSIHGKGYRLEVSAILA